MTTALTFLIWGITFLYYNMEALMHEKFPDVILGLAFLFLFFASFISAFQLDRVIIKLLKKKLN